MGPNLLKLIIMGLFGRINDSKIQTFLHNLFRKKTQFTTNQKHFVWLKFLIQVNYVQCCDVQLQKICVNE